MFDTKIAIVVRDDLATWQKLNVAAFLASGVLGANDDLLGEPYEDADGNFYSPLIVQPLIVLTTDTAGLKKIHERGLARGVRLSLYIEDMFSTAHDAANRAAMKQYACSDLNIVGLALRGAKRVVNKVTKGAKIHA